MTKLSQQERQRKKNLAQTTRPGKDFWANEGFIETLDLMAQRYGKLPSELLELTLHEFEMNIAIMARAIETDKARRNPKLPVTGAKSWKDLGIGYEVKE